MDEGEAQRPPDAPTAREAVAQGRRLGATEGTGLGFLAAGAILGMAWLGRIFGSPVPFAEGRFAGLFLLIGSAIMIAALRRGRA